MKENDDFGALMEADADAPPTVSMDDALKRLSAMAQQLLIAQFNAAKLDSQLAEQQELVRSLEEDDIPTLLKECGLKFIGLADGTRIDVTDELECSISEERRAAAHAWLREHGLGGVIKTELAMQFSRGEEMQARALAAALSIGLPPEAVEAIVSNVANIIPVTTPEEKAHKAEMLTALRLALMDTPAPEVAETVHAQTLKATLRAERVAGREVPAEPFALRPYQKAKLSLPDGAAKPAKVRKRK